MNLKQLLRNAGVRPDIAEEVEKLAKKTSEQKEQEALIRTDALAKKMINEALRYRKEHGPKTPPYPLKKTIIVPDDM
jgi:hypothetical protein